MEEIKLEPGEYKTAQSPDILDSGGLGPCIAVGAIYRQKGVHGTYEKCAF